MTVATDPRVQLTVEDAGPAHGGGIGRVGGGELLALVVFLVFGAALLRFALGGLRTKTAPAEVLARCRKCDKLTPEKLPRCGFCGGKL